MAKDRMDEYLNDEQRAARGNDVDASELETEAIGATPHTGRRQRVDRAIERLDAEVAAHEARAGVGLSMAESEKPDRDTAAWTAHEGDDELVCPACNRPYALHGIGCPTLSTETPRTIEIANLTDERVTYRVEALDPEEPHGIDATTGRSLGGPIVEPSAPTDEARFGDRLRRALQGRPPGMGAEFVRDLLSIAAAIDQDAAREIDRLERGQLERARHLRKRVEEAVERGRRSVLTVGAGLPSTRTVDVIDAEPFLEEVARIFGERPASSEWREMASEWNKATAEGLAEAAVASATAAWSEHESAHDRRERASARHEDSTGRVEGVDR